MALAGPLSFAIDSIDLRGRLVFVKIEGLREEGNEAEETGPFVNAGGGVV